MSFGTRIGGLYRACSRAERARTPDTAPALAGRALDPIASGILPHRMRYSVPVVKPRGCSLPFARLALLIALVTPLIAGPLAPDCVSCCPERAREVNLTAASCCGTGCPTMVRADPETSALVNRSVAAAPILALSPEPRPIGCAPAQPARTLVLQLSGSPPVPGALAALRL